MFNRKFNWINYKYLCCFNKKNSFTSFTTTNNHNDNKLALELAATLNLPGTGGSDAHCIKDIGRCYTEFFTPLQTLNDLIAALKAGEYLARNSGALKK